MMPLSIFFLLAWFLTAFADYNEYCYIWQLKEYRIDRFRDFLSTKTGRAYWKKYVMFWRPILALVAAAWPASQDGILWYALAAIFGADIIRNGYLFSRHRLRHPVYTRKAAAIIIFSLSVEAILVAVLKDVRAVFVLLALRFLVMTATVQAFRFPTRIFGAWHMYRARKKIDMHRNLVVIGVTGSYGKTTVKTFLGTILSDCFSVITTPKNVNSELGIAQFILNTDFSGKDFFVVEIGAYRVGEIENVCRMVKPAIGILTAINEQHLSLFGSIQNTQRAKYELLRSLPQNGLAIVNADNAYAREFIHTLSVPVKTFGTDADENPSCRIDDISGAGQGIHFRGVYGGEPFDIGAPVPGTHNALNIAACIIAARHVGMSMEQVAIAARKLHLPHQTLAPRVYGQAIILDDSYNSNPAGFLAALEAMTQFGSDKKRIVITRGIPELGPKSDEIHEEIGSAVAFAADVLVLITEDFEEAFRRGVRRGQDIEVHLLKTPEELLRYIQSLKETPSVILLENKMPEAVYTECVGREHA